MSITHYRRRTLPVPIERDVHHSLRVYAQRIGRAAADVAGEAVAQYLDDNLSDFLSNHVNFSSQESRCS